MKSHTLQSIDRAAIGMVCKTPAMPTATKPGHTDAELLPFVELFGAGYRSVKFKLFGYRTERQILNAIRRKLKQS